MTVINAANRDLPKDAVLYLLFTGNRYYYYERGVRGSYFSQQPIVQWFREKRSADYIAQKFGELGVTHLAIHNRRTKDSLSNSLDDNEKYSWTKFVKEHLELVFQSEPYSIWKLK